MQKLQYDLMYKLENYHFWFLGKREFIKAVLPKKNTRWQILDIGSGTGGTTKLLGNWGKVLCIENSNTAIKYLKIGNLKYKKMSIMNYHPEENRYDLVTLLDVLYHRHITNDTKVIQTAFQALKPNGLLLITDSALPYLMSYHDQLMHTRQRYYLGELEAKVRQTGFKIKKSSYIFFLIFPLFLLSRLVNKFIGYNTVSHVNPLLNILFLNICKIEARTLKYFNLPIGSSIIILARKP